MLVQFKVARYATVLDVVQQQTLSHRSDEMRVLAAHVTELKAEFSECPDTRQQAERIARQQEVETGAEVPAVVGVVINVSQGDRAR